MKTQGKYRYTTAKEEGKGLMHIQWKLNKKNNKSL
jgi:hypothetical protein